MSTKKPNKGEYWHVRFGLTLKEDIIVKVLEDKCLNPPNWYCNSFECELQDGNKIVVHGNAFIEKMDINW